MVLETIAIRKNFSSAMTTAGYLKQYTDIHEVKITTAKTNPNHFLVQIDSCLIDKYKNKFTNAEGVYK